MFELKWLQPESTTTLAPRLVYRHMQPCVDASGALCPGEWTDWKPVPLEIVTDETFLAARTPYTRPNA